MFPYWVMGFNLFGTKAILAYIVIIVIIVAVSMYTRRGAARR